MGSCRPLLHFLALCFFVGHSSSRNVPPPSTASFANCHFNGGSNGISGDINFRQTGEGQLTDIKVNISGISIEGTTLRHGVIIHQEGDTSDDCAYIGEHYNPLNVNHGGRLQSPFQRHVGDLGNIIINLDGTASTELKDYLIQLKGPYSVVGRSVAIHKQRDDLGKGGDSGSSDDGNVGDALGCCTIGISDDHAWQNE